MIEEIFYRVKSDALNFKPKFRWSEDINEVANKINLPHEDYPLRVEKTKKIIESYKSAIVRERDIKEMHSILFGGDGFNEKHILRGDYRKSAVTVGDFIPPPPLQLSYLMSRIMPVSIPFGVEEDGTFIKDDMDLIQWYILFETIHPFQDGNGRIGGIVVAILSRELYGKYLMPTT